MKNIFLIIQREYLVRVKKKSFIIMTILGPLAIGLLTVGIGYLGATSVSHKEILVNDASKLFVGKLKSNQEYAYSYTNDDVNLLKTKLKKIKKDALVSIPADILENPKGVKIYSEKGVSLDLQSNIERALEREIESIKLGEAGITQEVLREAKMNVNTETISMEQGGEKKNSASAATGIGAFCGFLIYLSVFIYGAQVMRSITEEKTNRIVEVIISSVKPFQLMIGKIVGVGLVGLTQFALWILFTVGIFTAGTKFLGDKYGLNSTAELEKNISMMPPEQKEAARANMQISASNAGIYSQVMGALDSLPVATIIISFFFYFLGGYLLYSALFGAIGSAVDNDTDTQQFMLPITIPIIAAFSISQFVIKDPNSSLAVWTSMIPFTSPIIMMVRIPFGVPIWQIALSIGFLIAGFIFTTWIAARIYRVGILMYGKKVTWKELAKWLTYKV